MRIPMFLRGVKAQYTRAGRAHYRSLQMEKGAKKAHQVCVDKEFSNFNSNGGLMFHGPLWFEWFTDCKCCWTRNWLRCEHRTAHNKACAIPNHTSCKNWNRSSAAMESDIIPDGTLSDQMYGLHLCNGNHTSIRPLLECEWTNWACQPCVQGLQKLHGQSSILRGSKS